ncbi:uncharacterized protein [Haliotis asinina]|uniref:uncharacterized protein n=1 Tax=Haliotis asinina TaxID=109174 RepID=UPI003531E151
MGKTRAEIQRDYRRRKIEKEGENYHRKERERMRKYYVPISERSQKDVRKRRQDVLRWVQKHRQKKREVKEGDTAGHNSTVRSELEEDENQVSSTVPTPDPLVVRLPFVSPDRTRTRTRISRISARQRKQINKLTAMNRDLMRKYKRVSKKYERTMKNMTAVQIDPVASKSSESSSNVTPRKRTDGELRNSGISPSKLPKVIVKKLLLANVVSDELKCARQEKREKGIKGKQVINQIVSGEIVKKYRMKRALSRNVGMNRRTLRISSKTCFVQKKRRLQVLHEKAKMSVEHFLSRDDNSRQMPGKADKKKIDD